MRNWTPQEPSELPGLLDESGDHRILSSRDKKRDITQYRILEGDRLQGTISVFNFGLKNSALGRSGEGLGVDLSEFVGEQGANFLAGLSWARYNDAGYSPNLTAHPELTPMQIYELGGVGKNINGFGCFGNPDSYRRHAVNIVEDDRRPGWVEAKIPGNRASHYNITKNNFIALVDLINAFLERGETPPVNLPIALINLPPHIQQHMYGQLRVRSLKPRFGQTIGSRFSANYILYDYVDGRRLVREGVPSVQGDTISQDYLHAVEDRSGKDSETLNRKSLACYIRVHSLFHEIGYTFSEGGHLGNMILESSGGAVYAGDPEAAKKRVVGRDDHLRVDIARMAVEIADYSRKHGLTEFDLPLHEYTYQTRDFDGVGLFKNAVKRARETRYRPRR